MDYILETLAARCAKKAAELHATSELHPNSITIKAEARAVELLGSTLTKLIGVQDDVSEFEEFEDHSEKQAADADAKAMPAAQAAEVTAAALDPEPPKAA